MIVVDASTTVDLLLRLDGHERIEESISSYPRIAAPELLSTEVLSCLRRWVRAGSIGISSAEDALADLDALPIKRYSHHALNGRVWELRDRFTAYDATYVALAEALDARLLTTDTKLRRAAGGLVDATLGG